MSSRGRRNSSGRAGDPFARGDGGGRSLKELDSLIYGAIEDAEREMLTVEADGSINIGSFAMTPVGLQVTGEASYDDWQNVGNLLRRLDASIQWLIGDWMAYGEHQWGQMYEAIAEAMGYEEKSLRNYTWVAKSVQLSLRRTI